MHTLKKLSVFALSLTLGCSLMISPAMAKHHKHHRHHKAKNIIFMVPDGQGLSNVTAARIFKNGPDGPPLYQETLANIGYQRTHSANATVTDSAAAASAWAIGEKVVNNAISCQDADGDYACDEPVTPTILELAKAKGMATGLVATSTITHATPAVWGAHVHTRYCETEIGRQLALVTGVDVLLGSGIGGDRAGRCMAPSPLTVDEIIAQAQANGLTYVTTRTAMLDAVATGTDKLMGFFLPSGKTPEMFRVDPTQLYPAEEPTLPEMTEAALDILEKDKDGMFLMVEGSQIDWADHANDVNYQIAESLAFDESVKVVLDWVDAKADRKHHTLIIIVADHDCGGFGINGPGNGLSEAGDVVAAGWTSGDHTAVDTIIYSQGPGSEQLNAAVDNTDLYYVMKRFLH